MITKSFGLILALVAPGWAPDSPQGHGVRLRCLLEPCLVLRALLRRALAAEPPQCWRNFFRLQLWVIDGLWH